MKMRKRKTTLTCLRSNDGTDRIRNWVSDRYDFIIQKRGRGNPRRKKKNRREYVDGFFSFDIETTNYKELKQSFMYCWSFCMDKYVLIGRTWEQFRFLMEELSLYLRDKEYIIIWVHNLSFEWQFLKSIFRNELTDVFALDNRKVVRMTVMEHFEFRCSYILTNNSLAQLTKNMAVKHRKLDGNKFDYTKVRTPGRDLKKYELLYSAVDVLGLCEALKVYFRAVGCNFYNIPMTNTGFVRNDLKLAIRRGCRYSYMTYIQPDLPLLHALHDSFRGGNTHGSRYMAGRIVGEIDDFDRESSYPAELINKNYPHHFVHCGKVTWQEMCRKVKKNKMAALLVVRMVDVKLRDPFWPVPYLAIGKCRKVRDAVEDNGRLISCSHLITTINDVDLRILVSEYQFKIEILDSWFSAYKPLPEAVKDVLRKYGSAKTLLKGVAGQELDYQVAKGRFNSIYGCCVMYPIKPHLVYKDGEFIDAGDKSEEELLTQYSKKGFLPYQWGVWCTSWARYELERGMKMVGHKLVYTDTDSLKFLSDPSISFDAYNEEMIELARKNNAVFLDKEGKEHFLGRFLSEGHHEKFVTLGAKKYVTEDQGHLALTLAGVKKKAGAKELSDRGGIKAFKEGFVFRKSAGLSATYNDDTDEVITILGEKIHLISNIYLEASEYTLGITDDYDFILKLSAMMWNDEIDRNKLLTK